MRKRRYQACPEHGSRMIKIDENSDTYGDPPRSIHRYYRCRRVRGCYWTLNAEVNGISPGLPRGMRPGE